MNTAQYKTPEAKARREALIDKAFPNAKTDIERKRAWNSIRQTYHRYKQYV